MADLWRIKHREGTHRSSHGRVNIYESRRKAEGALYRLLLDMHADGGVRAASDRHPKHQWFRLWRNSRQEDAPDAGDVRVQRVLSVEHLVDGDWVPYEFELHPPKLDLTTDLEAPSE